MFVYSDNNPPIEKQYKIFIDNSISGFTWDQINIKEYKWWDLRSKKTQNSENTPRRSVLIESQFSNNRETIDNTEPRYEDPHKRNDDDYTTGNRF